MDATPSGRRLRRAVAVMVAVVAGLVVAGSPASAQTVDLATPFPTVNAEPGQQVTLDLTVYSGVRQQVDLEVVSAPEGWATTLRGGGFEISSVTTEPEAPPTVELQVDVPADATDSGQIVVAADGRSGGSDQLTIRIDIAESVAGAVTLETDFPRLEGGAEDTFTYDVTLRNSTGEEITCRLGTSAPQGWQVDARPSLEDRASTITVEGGSTGTVTVEATPPANVGAGEYPIALEASCGGRTARIELVANVTGTVQLTLTTPSERLNAAGVAGAATTFPLLVVNDGTAPLRGVQLSASPPADWEVTFQPSTIEAVPPGESVRVETTVTPAGNAIVGDYIVTMTASTEAREASTDIRFTVETSTAWGIAGVVVIVAAILGLGWIFRRYGRR